MTILDINPSVAGIAGDMFIAGLLQFTDENILVNVSQLIQEINQNFHVKKVKISQFNIHGLTLKFNNEKDNVETNSIKNIVEKLIKKLGIAPKYRKVAIKAIDILFEAEKHIHQSQDVHLHELATIDTIFDIVGVVYLLDFLGIEGVIIHSIATGTGTVQTEHGILPVPAPATQYILEKGKLITNIGPRGEATTPTGAAILYALKSLEVQSDNIIWDRSSYGFGSKVWKDRANCIRLRIGSKSNEKSKIAILETNLDDVSGEILGDAVDRLLEAGALDVNYYSIIMKKNRPAYTLRVLVTMEDTVRISDLIIDLTGTLGVRQLNINRHIGNREIDDMTVFVEKWDKSVKFKIKKSRRNKIEFDDIVRIAEEIGKTPLEVQNTLSKYLE